MKFMMIYDKKSLPFFWCSLVTTLQFFLMNNFFEYFQHTFVSRFWIWVLKLDPDPEKFEIGSRARQKHRIRNPASPPVLAHQAQSTKINQRITWIESEGSVSFCSSFIASDLLIRLSVLFSVSLIVL